VREIHSLNGAGPAGPPPMSACFKGRHAANIVVLHVRSSGRRARHGSRASGLGDRGDPRPCGGRLAVADVTFDVETMAAWRRLRSLIARQPPCPTILISLAKRLGSRRSDVSTWWRLGRYTTSGWAVPRLTALWPDLAARSLAGGNYSRWTRSVPRRRSWAALLSLMSRDPIIGGVGRARRRGFSSESVRS